MPNPHILAADLPGVLDGVVLPIEQLSVVDGKGWLPGVSLGTTTDGIDRNTYYWTALYGLASWSTGRDFSIRLDLTRPEVQHHLALTWGPRNDGRKRVGCLTCKDHWLSLLGNPEAIAAECRAVAAHAKETT